MKKIFFLMLFAGGLLSTYYYIHIRRAARIEPLSADIELACHDNGLVFDIGANCGNKTEAYLYHGARVVCVEPQPMCLDILKKKFNHNQNVSIVPKAIAEKCGNIELFICKNSVFSSCSQPWMKEGRFANQGKWEQKILVATTTLDELIKQFGIPKFCKIDVEGFEYQVLSGLSTKIPLISFEFTLEFIKTAQACIDLLTKLGYQKFNVALGETSDLALQQWVSGQEVIAFLLQQKKNDWGDIYAKA